MIMLNAIDASALLVETSFDLAQDTVRAGDSIPNLIGSALSFPACSGPGLGSLGRNGL